MANFIEVVDRAAELTATLVKEYVDNKTAAAAEQFDAVGARVDELSAEVREVAGSFSVDGTVTAEGSNAVSGAAVAAYVTDYVAQQLNAITDYEGVAF